MCYPLSMIQLPETIVLYDTEYTTWEGAQERKWSGPNEFKELVQIGAIHFNTKTLKETDSLLLYLRPVKNPILSDYFTKLTHITQEDIETRGTTFGDAVDTFARWIGKTPCYAYGRDKEVFDIDYVLYGMENPLSNTQFFDIREIFKSAGIDTKKFMSSTIIEAFGKANPSRGHDALNDARGIAYALTELMHGTQILSSAKHQHSLVDSLEN